MEVPKISVDTPSGCLKLLQDYLPNEFGPLTEDDIEYGAQTGGLVNTLKLITRKKDNFKVLIREYGGNVFDVDLFRNLKSPLSWQLLIFHELSKLGVGPKLLGVFEEGRIEEFIPSHTLRAAEYDDPDIMKDLAINTAIVHSLKLPFNQSSTVMLQMMKQWHENFAKTFNPVQFIGKYKDPIINCCADFGKFIGILKHDWMGEGTRLRDITDKFEKRQGLIVWDNNSLNVLIRDNPKPGQLRTCIIDFECCRYDSVVRDISARFVIFNVHHSINILYT